MEQFAVLHIKKYKDLSKIGRHIERSVKEPIGFIGSGKTSVGVDPSRKGLNEELVETEGSIQQDVEKKIATLVSNKYRKDAVKAIGVLLTGSHEQMQKIQEDTEEFERWKKENLAFIAREFGGKENIVRMSLHMDERTPHFHAIIVPVKDGRLSAAQFLNGKSKIIGLQDRYYNAMHSFGFHRGISKALTGREHKTVKDYRREVQQSITNTKNITKDISFRNILNLPKVKEKVEEKITHLEAKNRELGYKAKIAYDTVKNVLHEQAKKQLENVKKNVNLVQHIASMGYKVVKSKTSRKWVVMEKKGDRILVLADKNEKGSYYYQSTHDSNDKGTIVDFMINRGYSLNDIRGLSSNHLDDTVLQQLEKSPKQVKDRKLAKEIAQARIDKWIYNSTDNYLLNRGIKQKTIEKFGIKTNENTALFPLTLSGELISTIIYNQKGKYFQKGLERGVSVLGNLQTADRIVICESPIDALSYDQLATDNGSKEDIAYIATCGAISKEITEEIKSISSKKTIIIAFDNDEAGEKMTKQVEGLLKGRPSKRHIPRQGKDWNDVLRFIAKAGAEDTREQDKEHLKHEREQKETQGLKIR